MAKLAVLYGRQDSIRAAGKHFSSESRVKAHRAGAGMNEAPDDLVAALYADLTVETHNYLNEELRSETFFEEVRSMNKQIHGYSYGPNVRAMGIADQVKEFKESIENKLSSLVSGIEAIPGHLEDIPGHLENVGDFFTGMGDDVVGWGQDAGSWGVDKAKDAGSWVIDKAKDIGDWITNILSRAAGEYQKVKAGTRKVLEIIKSSFGGPVKWWNRVVLENTEGKSGIVKVAQMYYNFGKWWFGLIDQGLGFIIKAPLTGIILFLDKLGEAVGGGYIKLYNTSRARRGPTAQRLVHAMVSFVDFYDKWEFKTLSEGLGQLRDSLANTFKEMFNRVSSALGQAIVAKGGSTKGLSGFADLDLIAGEMMEQLIALENQPMTAGAVVKRITLLIKITFKVIFVTIKRVVLNIFVPLILALVEFVKKIIEEIIRIGVKVSKPVAKFLWRVITSPINIGSWALLNALNESDRLKRMKTPVGIGIKPLKGDQIRNFANLFGIKSDGGALLLFIGVSAVVGSVGFVSGAIVVEKLWKRWKLKKQIAEITAIGGTAEIAVEAI